MNDKIQRVDNGANTKLAANDLTFVQLVSIRLRLRAK
ncbi:hypothetical protein M2222_008479 [Bradyrhizobium elkanii]|nr:hypothetical protein [Bradyrhizobium elkanii]MCS3566157.1 hypothetical protein [Bradyrhizobium elkanii]MCW2153113.1 hypothetical protein [Bradyrhizobium elkanii]MCW2357148.1 hypothetical protein [Bradyrhizobium elkanii]MCW2376846.1 hypothetical protein [Bradyrhizobium elkanii]